MSPDKNPELYRHVAVPSLEEVGEEFVRRNLVGGVMVELSRELADKDHTPHPVTDPLLVARLYALSSVMRTRMGIVGFNPLEAINHSSRQVYEVTAKAAPHHDEFTDPESHIFRTRVIALKMPEGSSEDSIEIFGLNVYQPDASAEDLEPSTSSSGLILIGAKGDVANKEFPITGETAVFAVRHKRTNDTKIYYVQQNVQDTQNNEVQGICHESEHVIKLRTPDNLVIVVEQLKGTQERQAVFELEASIRELRKMNNPNDLLASEERVAISDILLDQDFSN